MFVHASVTARRMSLDHGLGHVERVAQRGEGVADHGDVLRGGGKRQLEVRRRRGPRVPGAAAMGPGRTAGAARVELPAAPRPSGVGTASPAMYLVGLYPRPSGG